MTETLKYSVLRKHNKIELRRYQSYIQAEVKISEKDYRSAAWEGFNILAGYIFGNNISKQKIDTTASVQITQSEKIAMTSPVTVRDGGQYTVAFMMPSQYRLDMLPTPTDNRIHFTVVPEQDMAVIRFNGFFQTKSINQHKDRLVDWVQKEGLEMEGDFIVAGYDPPWVPWFIARNEVLVKVTARF